MANKLVYNPISGEFDYIGGATGGGAGVVSIPQYDADPVSPNDEDAWVLHIPAVVAGEPIGLLLALTYAANAPDRYYFSYKTISGPIKRAEIT